MPQQLLDQSIISSYQDQYRKDAIEVAAMERTECL
jgi:hypothetical protein